MKKILNSIHPDDDLHYQKMGLKKGEVEIWEDGLRTDGSKGSYEWWYFDSHYEDGSKLVIIFFNKSPIEASGPVKPQATIEYTLADGTKVEDKVECKIEESFFDTKQCDVRVGNSRIVGDLKHYDIIVSAGLVLGGNFMPLQDLSDKELHDNLCVQLIKLCEKEDEELKKRIGQEWQNKLTRK